ncbi:MAG: hypothetical protein J0L88_11930 [Xanthomonadales bacterium]|nr:hypothetical protein [Xanthomonadales bacterium]
MPNAFLSRLLALALLGASLPLAGQELDRLDFEVTVETPADFRDQAGRVRASLAPDGRHATANDAERGRIEALLLRIEAIFDARGSGQALSEGDRLQVLNAQEEINAILARRDGDRLVCEFVMRTGSHRRGKECLTVREREARRAAEQQALREIERGRSVRGDGS